ncbi:hypothetical protein BH09BAC2_BH09BAC2_18760 [soil metagenome]
MKRTWLIAAGLGVAGGAAYLISRRLNTGTPHSESRSTGNLNSGTGSTNSGNRSNDPFGRTGGTNYSDIE